MRIKGGGGNDRTRSIETKQLDHGLFDRVALALTILGLVMLYSAGVTARHGPDGLLTRQIMWVSLSLLVGVYAAFMNLDWLRKRIWWIFGLCMLGLVLTLIPGLGVKVNGAQRWLGLGPLRIQPSEFAKIGLVFALASYFSSRQREVKSLLYGFVVPSAIIGTMCSLIILQPDFGTCFLCGAVAATMMFQAGTSLRWLLPAVSLAILVFSILVYFDPHRYDASLLLDVRQMPTTVLFNYGRACWLLGGRCQWGWIGHGPLAIHCRATQTLSFRSSGKSLAWFIPLESLFVSLLCT